MTNTEISATEGYEAMRLFMITARTAFRCDYFFHYATASGRAAEDAASMYEQPCGITVIAGAW